MRAELHLGGEGEGGGLEVCDGGGGGNLGGLQQGWRGTEQLEFAQGQSRRCTSACPVQLAAMNV